MSSSELQVEIVARGPDPQRAREAVREAFGHDRLRSELAVSTTARAHIDRFVDGADITGTDVVLWYAGHFTHDVGHDHAGGGPGHIVGPTLTLDGWD